MFEYGYNICYFRSSGELSYFQGLEKMTCMIGSMVSCGSCRINSRILSVAAALFSLRVPSIVLMALFDMKKSGIVVLCAPLGVGVASLATHGDSCSKQSGLLWLKTDWNCLTTQPFLWVPNMLKCLWVSVSEWGYTNGIFLTVFDIIPESRSSSLDPFCINLGKWCHWCISSIDVWISFALVVAHFCDDWCSVEKGNFSSYERVWPLLRSCWGTLDAVPASLTFGGANRSYTNK